MIRVGIVGVGYWGPNLVRCFSEISGCRVSAICDRSPDQLNRIQDRYPQVAVFDDVNQMLASGEVDAIIVATPTKTHFDLAIRALEHGLHVLVEKPLAETTDQCRQMIAVAQQNACILFVGHVFLHSSPVQKLRELIAEGELGRINYISSRRLNLGPVRKDVSALYDLATHDISMMLYLMGCSPLMVSCCGVDILKPGNHDVCNLSMQFPDNRMGMVHVSWLDPRKERVLTVVGDRKMAVYDDLDQEKIKVFDKGVILPPETGDFAEFQFSYRHGGSYSPYLNEKEPLKAECLDFIRCIQKSQQPVTGGSNGMEVVEVLQAAHRSLMASGAPVSLNADEDAPWSDAGSAFHASTVFVRK